MTLSESTNQAGWASDLETFQNTDSSQIILYLKRFIPDYSPQQLSAWEESITIFKNTVTEILIRNIEAISWSVIFEYRLKID